MKKYKKVGIAITLSLYMVCFGINSEAFGANKCLGIANKTDKETLMIACYAGGLQDSTAFNSVQNLRDCWVDDLLVKGVKFQACVGATIHPIEGWMMTCNYATMGSCSTN